MEVYVTHADHAPTWHPATDGAKVVMDLPAYIELDLHEPARIGVSHGHWTFASRDASGPVRIGPLPSGIMLDVIIDAPNRSRFESSIRLLRGQQRKIDVQLDPGRRIRGMVQPPQAGVRIEAHQGDSNRTVAWSAADGSFELSGLREGEARIVAIPPGDRALVVDAQTGEFLNLEWER